MFPNLHFSSLSQDVHTWLGQPIDLKLDNFFICNSLSWEEGEGNIHNSARLDDLCLKVVLKMRCRGVQTIHTVTYNSLLIITLCRHPYVMGRICIVRPAKLLHNHDIVSVHFLFRALYHMEVYRLYRYFGYIIHIIFILFEPYFKKYILLKFKVFWSIKFQKSHEICGDKLFGLK